MQSGRSIAGYLDAHGLSSFRRCATNEGLCPVIVAGILHDQDSEVRCG